MKISRKNILIASTLVLLVGASSAYAIEAWFSTSPQTFNVVADFSTSGTMAIANGDYQASVTTPCTGGPTQFSCPNPVTDLLPGQSVTYFTQVESQLPGITPKVNLSAGTFTSYSITTHYATMNALKGNTDGPVVQGPIQLVPNQAYWLAITITINADPTLGPVTWSLSYGA